MVSQDCIRRVFVRVRIKRGIVMNALMLRVRKFMESEDGPTAVEYAVMLALIVVVCLTTIQSLGTNANATFSSVSTALTSASS